MEEVPVNLVGALAIEALFQLWAYILQVCLARGALGAGGSVPPAIVLGLCREMPLPDVARFGMAAGGGGAVGSDVERLYPDAKILQGA